MPSGPGIYDDECTLIRAITQAPIVMVIVCGGIKGTGFSVQTHSPMDAFILADTLEDAAKQIRESMKV